MCKKPYTSAFLLLGLIFIPHILSEINKGGKVEFRDEERKMTDHHSKSFLSKTSKVVPIVHIGAKKLKIDVFAINNVLDKIGQRPFAVYSISGPARTGKSYILSQCVRYLQGSSDSFEWRGESDRCTKGINLWSDPLEVRLKNGTRIPIILIDTQGCFDDKTSLELDAQLFGVTTLFSSVQVFNTLRTIDEATLQFLEAFTGVASMCNAFHRRGSTGSRNTSPDFQKLLILVRDFQFRDYKFGYYDNTHVPPGETRNYKLDKLNPQDMQPEIHQEIRQNIIESYQETAAFLMPHPGKNLAMFDNLNDLDEDFKNYEKEFIALLFHPDNLILKNVNEKFVSGTEFKEYVKHWSEILEKIEDMKLPKTSESASEIQYLTGMEAAKREYLRNFEQFMKGQKFRISDHELHAKHTEIISSLCQTFERKLYFKNRNKNHIRFEKEINTWGVETFSKYQKRNLKKYEHWIYYLHQLWSFICQNLIFIVVSVVLGKIIISFWRF